MNKQSAFLPYFHVYTVCDQFITVYNDKVHSDLQYLSSIRVASENLLQVVDKWWRCRSKCISTENNISVSFLFKVISPNTHEST